MEPQNEGLVQMIPFSFRDDFQVLAVSFRASLYMFRKPNAGPTAHTY